MSNSAVFEQWVFEMAQVTASMVLVGREVLLNLREREEIFKVKELCKILPFINKHIHLTGTESPILKETFF